MWPSIYSHNIALHILCPFWPLFSRTSRWKKHLASFVNKMKERQQIGINCNSSKEGKRSLIHGIFTEMMVGYRKKHGAVVWLILKGYNVVVGC